MREIVVISGKGGTGKTSLTAAFAILNGGAVVADCDVDAADLHLVLEPRVRARHEFYSGRKANIRSEACNGCGDCLAHCRFDAIRAAATAEGAPICTVDPIACEGCGLCVRLCRVEAIDFPERRCGEWMISDARSGPMAHARLGIAAENSGKLVSTVRREARRLAEAEGRQLVLVDGPPGIGCPVIASVTGASLVVVVTEPTVSGAHDLARVLSLARHFDLPAAVCINKWDLSPALTARIEAQALAAGAAPAGRVRYDTGVTRAQLAGRTVVEIETPCAEDVVQVWRRVSSLAEGAAAA